MLVLRVADRAEKFFGHDFGEADHGVERCAQFVAHVCEERALSAACFLGALAFFVRFACERLDAIFLALGAGERVGEAALVLRQLFFFALQRRYVDADRDDAAIGGAALDDVQPLTILQLDDAHVRIGRVVLFAANVRRSCRRHRLVGDALT